MSCRRLCDGKDCGANAEASHYEGLPDGWISLARLEGKLGLDHEVELCAACAARFFDLVPKLRGDWSPT